MDSNYDTIDFDTTEGYDPDDFDIDWDDLAEMADEYGYGRQTAIMSDDYGYDADNYGYND